MAASAQRKGPAEAATSPSRGSQSPQGNRNMDTNTTTPSPRPDKEARLQALLDLETDIFDVAAMSQILGDMLDGDLVGYDDKGNRYLATDERAMRVWLTKGQMDLLCFAWNDVIVRALRLQARFRAAADGKAVAS